MNELTALTFGLQAFVTLLVILDPPGATPLFLSLTSHQKRRDQVRMAWLAALTSLSIIAIFAVFGQLIVSYLDISIPALQGAGGLLLLLVSLDLLKGTDQSATNNVKSLALVPLGTPLLAGPGAIVTIMLFSQRVEGAAMTSALALAVIGAHLIIGMTLTFATSIVSVIKESGVMLLAKIAGLLTAAIAFEMLITGIKELLG
ncbi:MAG: NAAT family transporter [Actinobacteria bacterium]|nr:NAAT family transporter [Actinomycetota bacterium]NCW34592.1 NAAT family transporter [Actinomycetota bacterium]NDA41885.1 NAAT family transporter [Actinomycetota bacterium]NDB31321.1 NAAT family transporter [Actinomycetota bacterium]NDC12520.1 NAAT family transporter [Actinomycetota bacterium]